MAKTIINPMDQSAQSVIPMQKTIFYKLDSRSVDIAAFTAGSLVGIVVLLFVYICFLI
ncbi:MAG TPA: hypothetical protein VIM16_18020 [Mucilaginibacter sp.]|jgi:hypothetical protein